MNLIEESIVATEREALAVVTIEVENSKEFSLKRMKFTSFYLINFYINSSKQFEFSSSISSKLKASSEMVTSTSSAQTFYPNLNI